MRSSAVVGMLLTSGCSGRRSAVADAGVIRIWVKAKNKIAWNRFSIFADQSSIKVGNCDEHFEQRSPDSVDVWYGESLLNVLINS